MNMEYLTNCLINDNFFVSRLARLTVPYRQSKRLILVDSPERRPR